VFKENPDSWFDAWSGEWNGDWQVGKVIQVADEQWQEPSDPKYNWTIKAPEGAKYGVSRGEFNELVDRVNALENQMSELEVVEPNSNVPEEEIPIIDEPDEQVKVENGQIKNIPF